MRTWTFTQIRMGNFWKIFELDPPWVSPRLLWLHRLKVDVGRQIKRL